VIRSISRSLSRLLFVFICLFAVARVAQADVVKGRVLDPQNRPVAHARVVLVSGDTVVGTATTDSDGRYGPVTVPAGDYDVVVSANGLHAPAKRISVPATGTIEADVTMAVAAVNESLIVSGQTGQLLSRVTDSVTVVSRADLEARQTETATEALRLVPGFSMIANGGRGALMSVFPRGGESDYTLVLMNGIPLNAFGGGFDGAHLSTAGIDRIEVVRGPQSAVFGSGAIGGVVNVITRSGGPTEGGALFEVSGQGTNRFVGSANGGHGPWSWGGGFEYMKSDGDTSFRESIGTNVSNDDYERIIGNGTFGWSDRATRSIRVDARVGRDERGNPGPYGSDPFGLYSGLDTISRSINEPRGVATSAVFGDARTFRHSALVTWSDTPSNFVSPFGESDDETRRVSGRYQLDFDRHVGGFSTGVEFVRERADNTFVTGTLFDPVPVLRNMVGLFIEGRFDLGAKAAITAGARAEYIQRAALEETFGRPAFSSDVVWSVNPKVSGVWFLQGTRTSDAANGWTKIRGGAGTGIKPPTVFEIAFTDNPSLKPERSRSMDIGLEHGFPGGLVVADVTYFANRYDDLIVRIGSSFSGASPYQTDNIANASAKGVEVGVRWQSHMGLSVRGAYTYLDTEILAVDNTADAVQAPYTVGSPLIRRPKHQGSLDVRYTHTRTQLFLLVNGRNEMADFEPNFAVAVLTCPGYVTLAAGGSFRLGHGFDAYARVTNLLNRDYEDALGYPAQARSASVGLRVAIGK
jgi:outer membrane cobalamin receptor